MAATVSKLSQSLCSTNAILTLEAIVKEGIIQRFEYTFELAWKTLKDKMEFDGLQFTQISLKLIFKQAFQAQYIDKVEIWLQMTDDRNLISHTYDHSVFDTVLLIRILKKHIQDGSCIVYGSRAQGNYKKHSDIDLVIKNSKNQESHTLGPLKDALNESNFPYLVDIQFYETIKNQALKNHIDRVGQKLY